MGRAGSQKFRTRAHRLAHPDPDPSGNRRTRGLRIRGRRPSAVCRQNLCTHDRGQSPEAFRPCIRARNRPWTRTGYPGIPDRNRPTASANPCSRPRTNPKDHENLYTHAPNPPLTQTGHPGIPDRNHPTASENPCTHPQTNPTDHENLCTHAPNRPQTVNPCNRARSSQAYQNPGTHGPIRPPMTVSRSSCSLRARNSRRHCQSPSTHGRPHHGNPQRAASASFGCASWRHLPPWNRGHPCPGGQHHLACHGIQISAWNANSHRRPDATPHGSGGARRIPSMSVSARRQA